MRSHIPVLAYFFFLLLALLGHPPARSDAETASTQGKNWAVVIGINDYQKAPRLHYAIQDAMAIGNLLAQQGFTVISKISPKDTTRQAIETILGTELPKRLGSNDRVLVFFSGHGQDDPNGEGTKMGYLLPIEANPENLAATAISMGRVREWANFWRAKHVLFIVDSCYSGIIGENAKSIPAMTAQYVNQITREKARQLIVAGEADQEALEIGEWGQSLLTHFLLEGLGKNRTADLNSDGIILTSELYQFLDRRVYEEAQLRGGREQRPRQYSLSGDKGEFVFLGQREQEQPVQPVKIPTSLLSTVPSSSMVQIAPGYHWMLQVGDLPQPPTDGNWPKISVSSSLVHFEKPFAIARYETTFDEYDRFVQGTGRPLPEDKGWGRGAHPVINVSWNDAKAYAEWLSQQTGKRYRLPTEAEWEYAAGSGELNRQWAGTSDRTQLKKYAVYGTKHPEPVGSRKPNEIGLYDMSGNVSEWVEDCWHDKYEGAPSDGSAWLLTNGGDCNKRVIRGGNTWDDVETMRTSTRNWVGANTQEGYLGFRLAQDLP